ncbi:MAG: small multi-drug export protein [Oscillospiraceae bacterium]|nr:small multi-drug export protein [Oscillospiraceae bacterium]
MKLLIAFGISMLPIIELRGGIPYAMLNGIPFWEAFLVCFAGNILPVPFILFFIRIIFDFMEKLKITEKLIKKLRGIAEAKSDKVKKYQYFGLLMLVAIPLPGTGAWTGSLIAALMNLPVKKSFPTIAVGVLLAGIFMSILSYFIPGLFFNIGDGTEIVT